MTTAEKKSKNAGEIGNELRLWYFADRYMIADDTNGTTISIVAKKTPRNDHLMEAVKYLVEVVLGVG